MADLTITATAVLAGGNARKVDGVAGATITAGQVVYRDSAGALQLADCDSGTAAARSPLGIALNGAATGQPVEVLVSGNITIGATVAPGVAYYLSPTAGGICPDADVLAGDHAVLIGFGQSTSVIRVSIVEAGVARV